MDQGSSSRRRQPSHPFLICKSFRGNFVCAVGKRIMWFRVLRSLILTLLFDIETKEKLAVDVTERVHGEFSAFGNLHLHIKHREKIFRKY